MSVDNITFVDMFDWSLEHREQEQKLLDGTYHNDSERLPARIIIKIKPRKNDDQTNKRAFRRTGKKRL